MTQDIVPLSEQRVGETEPFELPNEEVDVDYILDNEAIDPDFFVLDEDIEGESDIQDLDPNLMVEDDEGDIEEEAAE